MTREDEELVKAMRDSLPPQVDYAELVCSPVPSSYGIRYVWDDPIFYLLEQAAAAIERLSARVAELREAQRWIPVSERLPEYSMPYLTIDHGMCETLNYDANTNKWMDYEGYSANVTHWKPLPKPPEVRDAE